MLTFYLGHFVNWTTIPDLCKLCFFRIIALLQFAFSSKLTLELAVFRTTCILPQKCRLVICYLDIQIMIKQFLCVSRTCIKLV